MTDEPGSDYGDICREYERVFNVKDTVAVDVALATVATCDWDGDPLWVFIVGAPSSGKTEILRIFDSSSEAFKGLGATYYLSSLTPRSLISGLRDGKDLLPELDGKTLIVKDFTTTLNMHREDRDALFGALRDTFDGTYSKNFGTRGTVRYDSQFHFLAAVTSAIEEYYTVQAVLGQRFLMVRTSFPDDFIADDARRIAKDRERLQAFAASILRRARNFPEKPPISSEFVRTCKEMAREVATLRAHVSRDSYGHDISAIPEPEAPARLTNQFLKLARGLALVHAKSDVTEEEMKIVRRVARDTVPSVRMSILRILRGGVETIDDAAKELGLARRTVERKLEDMVVLKALIEDSSGKPYRYLLARDYNLLPAPPGQSTLHPSRRNGGNDSPPRHDGPNVPPRNGGGDVMDRHGEGIPVILEVLRELCEGGRTAEGEDLVRVAMERGIRPERTEGILKRLKTDGDLWEPVKGTYRLTGSLGGASP